MAYFTRTTAAKEQEIEFDTSLLEENENLQANEIMWNNLTADSLQMMWVLRKCNCKVGVTTALELLLYLSSFSPQCSGIKAWACSLIALGLTVLSLSLNWKSARQSLLAGHQHWTSPVCASQCCEYRVYHHVGFSLGALAWNTGLYVYHTALSQLSPRWRILGNIIFPHCYH